MIASCAFGVIAAWTGCLDKAGRASTPVWVGPVFLAITIIFLVQYIWFVRHVRRVEVDDKFLYISGHPSDTRVPLADIACVKQLGWGLSPIIVIRFFDRSPVASPVYLISQASFRSILGVHSTVDYLKWLRDEARRKREEW
jgi:hypothetical protein